MEFSAKVKAEGLGLVTNSKYLECFRSSYPGTGYQSNTNFICSKNFAFLLWLHFGALHYSTNIISVQALTTVFPSNTSTVIMWLLQPPGHTSTNKISLSNSISRQVLSPYPWVHLPTVYTENGILLEGMGSHLAPASLWQMVKVIKKIKEY